MSRLPAKEHLGVETSVQPVMQTTARTEVYMAMEGVDEEETVLMTDEDKQKGKLCMDPVIRTLWPHKEYSVFVGEDIGSGKIYGNARDNLKGFVP